jgi:hypothetical protein
MTLTYRGINYTPAPNPTPIWGPVWAIGTYRGAPIPFRSLAVVPPQPEADLTWRGVAYHRASTLVPTPVEPTPVPIAAPSVWDRARNLLSRRHQKQRQRERAMLMRLDPAAGLNITDGIH